MGRGKGGLVYCDCPRNHINRLVHRDTRRRHRLEFNRRKLASTDASSISTFAASRTALPSSIASYAGQYGRDVSNGAPERMDVDEGHGNSIGEDTDEADESVDRESSTEDESAEENRSPVMSSDYGSDESEELEWEDESGYSEEDESLFETEQDVMASEDVHTLLNELEAMKRNRNNLPTLTIDAKPAIDWKSTYPFFHYKFTSNTSDISYKQLRELLSEWHIDVRSLKTTREDLQQRLHLRMRKYDACIKGCMAFTGEHKLRGLCAYCGRGKNPKEPKEPRFYYNNPANAPEFYENLTTLKDLEPRATYCYLPLIPRLRLLYANKEWSKKMRYPKKFLENPETGLVRDVWDGEMMQRWIAKGSFPPNIRF